MTALLTPFEIWLAIKQAFTRDNAEQASSATAAEEQAQNERAARHQYAHLSDHMRRDLGL